MIRLTPKTPRVALDLLALGSPAHHRPLISAVRRGGCDWTVVLQREGAFRLPRQRPQILVIGDDVGVEGSEGPAAFDADSIRRFISRCRSVVILSAGAEAATYTAVAAVAARDRHDICLVETLPRHEGAWTQCVQSANADVALLICTVPAQGGLQ